MSVDSLLDSLAFLTVVESSFHHLAFYVVLAKVTFLLYSCKGL